MAIAFDAATATTAAAGGTTGSITHSTSGSDRLLIVAVAVTAAVDITGVTYNGVTMTELVSSQTVFSTTWKISYFYLVAPATGSNTVTATAASSVNKYIAAVSYTGVDQITPINAYLGGTSASTPLSLTQTSTVDNCWGVMIGSNADDSFDATGTNSVLRCQYGGIVGISDTDTVKSPAGSLNMTMPYGAGARQSGGVMSLITPATAAPSDTTNFFAFM